MTESKQIQKKHSITFGSQADLPPLPIPTLEETMAKFTESIEALHPDAEAKERSAQVVADFLKGDGPKLQEMLLEYDKVGRETGEIGSYVEEFWNESYLKPESSVVLNLNPCFVLEDSPDPKIARSPIKRAASLCFASVRMASQLSFEELRPDTFKGNPLCMDQYKSLFASARVPKRGSKDSINVFDESNHVAVMCAGSLYYFQALWPDGVVAVDEADIVDILTAIQNHANAEAANMDPILHSQQCVGVLTSLPRTEWAETREELVKASSKNEDSLQIIDSALFVLVLDDYIPKDKHDAAANMLHGSYLLKQHTPNTKHQTGKPPLFSDYQSGSCCNRWYDKMQIIVCGDGTAGINFEHSAIDGHTALRFVSDVYAETVISFAQSITNMIAAHDVIPNVIEAQVKRAATTLDSSGRTTLDVFPKKLQLEVPESVRRTIYYAETALGDEIVASDTFVLEFKDYGKSFITSNKLSPDSFVQMSMMLAYYRLYGKVVCAYEPVLTKSFLHGRTEAMRPATMEAKILCELFSSSQSTDNDKITALRHATKKHSQLVKQCAQGKGVDRHLFALKCIAGRNGVQEPPFFRSKPWQLLNHTILSTSNCGNPALAGFGFGPVVPDGLGIGYIIKDHQLHYSISSKHRQTRRYASTLEAILKEMASLFSHADAKAKVYTEDAAASSRRSIGSIPLNMISYDSYGDIWGESVQDISSDRDNRRTRSRLVGATRQKSFELKDLSLKGLQIQMRGNGVNKA